MALSPVRKCLIVGLCGLSTIILSALIFWVAVPKVVRNKIADILPLRRDTESWDRWKDLPVPIQYRIYIFQVNNPEEILNGSKPKVSERGPYVYNEERIKNIISLDEKSSTVTYEHSLKYKFDPKASAPLTEDDELLVVNPPAVLFGLVIDSLKKIRPVMGLYNTTIKKMWPFENPIFRKTKVKDYLFGGTPIMCNQSLTINNLDSKILCEAFKILHPKTTVLDSMGKDVHSFAFFKNKNETSDGIYKIDLGINDITKIGQIQSWNNLKQLSIWKAESCNKIYGTDSTIFRPYLEEDSVDSIHIYHTDICRSIKLTYSNNVKFKGINGRRYVPDKSFFGSVFEDSENHCFCPQTVKNITHFGGCLHSGVLELTGCQGVPVVVSFPHFLNAHPQYQKGVVGLSPDIEKHQIFLDLEPNTGYPLQGASRVQINTFLKSISEVDIMSKLPNVLLPTIWLEEKVELTDELIGVINSQLLNILLIVDIMKWLLLALGALLLLGSCVYYFWKIKRQNLK